MKRNLFIMALGITCLSLSISWSGDKKAASQLGEEFYGSLDLLSKNMSVQRDTNLPGAPKVEATADKEVNLPQELIKLDPAVKDKWDMKLTETVLAWQRHGILGNKDIKVCVIDTGADVNHPDLKANLNLNAGESCLGKKGKRVWCDKSHNGVDDDGNGFVDDVYGYDFAFNHGDVTDNHGHGTHIAGIIGAEGGNGIGISGIAPRVSIIVAKYYDPKAPPANNLLNTVRAIRYCTLRGADIINYSGGGLEPSEIEKKAIEDARDEKGRPILFIAAAGNERSNSDFKKYYPADYDLPNIISVTAVDRESNVLDSSNYGSESVDIAAPGKNIYSTLPGGKYGTMTGTSQATAIVTGAAVLVKAKFPDYSTDEIIAALTESGDFIPNKLRGKTNRQKSLNIYRALAITGEGVNATGIKPANVMNLAPNAFAVDAKRPVASKAAPLGMATDALAELMKKAEQELGGTQVQKKN